MKKSIQEVLDYFPTLESHLSTVKSDESKLNNVEQTFLSLIRFFQEPNKNEFVLNSILKELDTNWTDLAMRSIVTFFSEDTYAKPKNNYSVLTDSTTPFEHN